jgi:hypothetical protein
MKLNAQGFIEKVEELSGWKMGLSTFWKYFKKKLIKPAGMMNFSQFSQFPTTRQIPYFTEGSVKQFLRKLAKLEKRNKLMTVSNGKVFIIFSKDKSKATHMKNNPDRKKLFERWL